MKLGLALLISLASAAAPAAVTLLPGSSPQTVPAGVPCPTPNAVLVTAANGAPHAGARVPFNFAQFLGLTMDADHEAFECFPDAGWNCWATTDSQGAAMLPGFYSNLPGDFAVNIAGTTVRLTATPSNIRFKSLRDMWWSGPAENGWGMSIVEHGAQLFNVIYAYDVDGKPTWWAMPQGSWGTLRSSYSGNLYAPRSSPYFVYDASRFAAGNPAGQVTISLDGSDAATLSATFGASNVQKRITRMEFSPDTPEYHPVSDMWWGGESQNGWGVAIIERQGALFAVWLTYDGAGKPTWFVMPGGTWVDATRYSGPLLHTTGSPWISGAYDASALKIASTGSYTLHFTDPRHATLEYAIDGHSGSLPLFRQPF